jgi:hypothetical protein
MKYVRDNTGRFGQRPYYEGDELDRDCEHIVREFMARSCGGIVFPIPTDVLTKLIERDADYLDLYADLSGEGPNVEGVTEFRPGWKPRVLISMELTEDERREHRLRTTLTHEYGHVKFHNCLWGLQASFLAPPQTKTVCKRDTILDAPTGDWMEWQAGYVCGAILMPKGEVERVVGDYFKKQGQTASRSLDVLDATDIQWELTQHFNVSMEATRVRLAKLGYVVGAGAGPSLL